MGVLHQLASGLKSVLFQRVTKKKKELFLRFLVVCRRNERPRELLSVLLCEHFTAELLCYLGASRHIGQVRTLNCIDPHLKHV